MYIYTVSLRVHLAPSPHLHAEADVLQDPVHHVDAHVLLVGHQAGQQVGHTVDAVVLDVPDVDHAADEVALHIRLQPGKLPHLPQDLGVDGGGEME